MLYINAHKKDIEWTIYHLGWLSSYIHSYTYNFLICECMLDNCTINYHSSSVVPVQCCAINMEDGKHLTGKEENLKDIICIHKLECQIISNKCHNHSIRFHSFTFAESPPHNKQLPTNKCSAANNILLACN